MLKNNLKEILKRAIYEPEFCNQLFIDISPVIKEYKLSTDEIDALKSIDKSSFIALRDEIKISIIREKENIEELPLLLI